MHCNSCYWVIQSKWDITCEFCQSFYNKLLTKQTKIRCFVKSNFYVKQRLFAMNKLQITQNDHHLL